MSRLVAVVGAGLAGLVAAVAAREAGADVVVFERDRAPGGATAASAGWIWRYRDAATARAFAPLGDQGVHDMLLDRFDDAVGWLEARGVRILARDTRRAFTVGVRVDPGQALDALVHRVGQDSIQTRTRVVDARPGAGSPVELRVVRSSLGDLPDAPEEWLGVDAVVFCGGGYALDVDRIARESGSHPDAVRRWVARAPDGGDGSSMDAAVALGAVRVPGAGECMTRLALDLPRAAPVDGLRVAELTIPEATLLDGAGDPIARADHDWSGSQLAWQLARRSGRGRLIMPRSALRIGLHSGSVEDALRAAIGAGAASGRTDEGGAWIEVSAGITHTRCGLRIDPRGRLVETHVPRLRRTPRERPVGGAYAAGMDAADIGLGGTASGLAQALVLGIRAGSDAGSLRGSH